MKDDLAKNLPTGTRRCWALPGPGHATEAAPLDEPLGGMNPEEIEFTLKAVQRTQEQGVTILIVEHNMQILDLCDRVVVISFGKKICEGAPGDVRDDEQVIQAYFGGEHAARC